jgi:hypothetical protein
MMLERLELPRGQRLAAIHNSAKVGGRGGHFACDSPAGDRLRQHSMIPYVAIWASKSSRATAAVLDWAYRLATPCVRRNPWWTPLAARSATVVARTHSLFCLPSHARGGLQISN